MSAWRAQLKRLSSKSVMYEASFVAWMSEYSPLSWSQIGPAIFTFVIAVQTFSLLFLNRDWSNRTCNIVLIVSWAILLLEMCIQHFVSVKPEKGPYYGISTGGYWCWISPKYTTERYATDHLSMIASAVFSLILYSLVFFRLRGNIRVSAGCKFSFHRRPKTGRTTEQIESYLTAVAKHMLWYPIVYITLAIPMAGIRYATYDGKYVDFVITMAISAVFMLHGFFNTVLFSTTRNILPETWRRRFGLGATLGGRRDVSESGATNPTCRDTGASTRDTSTIGTRTFSVVLNIHAEGVKIKSEARPSAEDVKSGSPTSRTLPISLTPSISRIPLFQIYGSSAQPANPDEHHIPRLSPPAPPGSRAGICSKVDEDDKTMAYTGIPLESTAKTVVLGVPEHPGCPSSHHESGAYGPDRV